MSSILDPTNSSLGAQVGANLAVGCFEKAAGITQYSVTGITGTMGAAIAANGAAFAMRMDPSASASRIPATIRRIRLDYMTVVAFTTPVTIGRSLALFRATSGTPAGGTSITTTAKKDSTFGDSEFASAGGGLIMAANATALTGLTLDTNPIRRFHLAQFGAANARAEIIWELSPQDSNPVNIRAGESLVIGVGPAAMDAAGTWNLMVNVDWSEGF